MKTRYISIFLTPLLLLLSTGCENEKDEPDCFRNRQF